MRRSPSLDGSLSTIEDDLYAVGGYMAEYLGIQPAVDSVAPQGNAHVDTAGRLMNKRVHFEDPDLDDGRPKVKRRNPRTGKESRLPKTARDQTIGGSQEPITMLAQKIGDVEAKAKALKEGKAELLKAFQEWVERSEKLMQEMLTLLQSK